jgi:hypothetical protein
MVLWPEKSPQSAFQLQVVLFGDDNDQAPVRRGLSSQAGQRVLQPGVEKVIDRKDETELGALGKLIGLDPLLFAVKDPRGVGTRILGNVERKWGELCRGVEHPSHPRNLANEPLPAAALRS